MCREVVRPGLSARGTRIKASVQQFGITCASDVRTRTGARGEAHAQKNPHRLRAIFHVPFP